MSATKRIKSARKVERSVSMHGAEAQSDCATEGGLESTCKRITASPHHRRLDAADWGMAS